MACLHRSSPPLIIPRPVVLSLRTEAKAGELYSYPASALAEEPCILNPRTLARPPIGHPLLPPIPRTLRTAFPPIYHPLSALPGTRAQISTGVPSRSNVATPNAFSYPYTDALPSAPPHSSIPVSHADATSLLILLYSPYIARSTALTLDLSAWPLIMRARPPPLRFRATSPNLLSTSLTVPPRLPPSPPPFSPLSYRAHMVCVAVLAPRACTSLSPLPPSLPSLSDCPRAHSRIPRTEPFMQPLRLLPLVATSTFGPLRPTYRPKSSRLPRTALASIWPRRSAPALSIRLLSSE